MNEDRLYIGQYPEYPYWAETAEEKAKRDALGLKLYYVCRTCDKEFYKGYQFFNHMNKCNED